MSKKGSNLLDYGIEEEVDPKLKFNSLISVTVSTVMCLAAKCPLPKSNVETTKLFLSTVTDENGKNPRNVKGFLSLLDDYSGPYDNNLSRENRFEKPPVEKLTPEEKKPSLESIVIPKSSVLVKDVASTDGQALVKRSSRASTLKKSEREPNKKGGRSIAPTKISTSKSVICSKS